MRFFDWGPSNQQGPSNLDIVKMETDAQIDFFQKMSTACSQKCLSNKNNDSELSVGEMSCVDRCCNKYVQAREIVYEANRVAEEKMQTMQKAGTPPPQMFK